MNTYFITAFICCRQKIIAANEANKSHVINSTNHSNKFWTKFWNTFKTEKNETSKSKTKTKQFPNQRLRWTWINELFLLLLLLESKVPFEIFLKHAFFHLLIMQMKKKKKIQNCNKFYYMKLTCRYTAPNGMGLMYVRIFEYTTYRAACRG